MIFDETIAAISTPVGAGGVSIVRISGKDALHIADLVFHGKQKPSELQSHTIRYGLFVDPATKEKIDAVLLSIIREPKSYTGLDTVEINCHGGVLNTRRILEIVINHGARLAEPGEFTKISFLNGKMDLSQVEAVADLIHAKTEGARKSSISQLMGSLSSEIADLKSRLLHLCSLLELDLDFAEENLLNIDSSTILGSISEVEFQVRKLLSTYNTGHLIREGARVAILGKPNVGKSSLLNAILMKNRAIVSEIPGTTRDFIEESVDIGGIPFTFVDTAGLRETESQIEKIGIDITREQVENSDLAIFLMDSSEPFDENDKEIVSFLNRLRKADLVRNVIFVCNKTDIKDPDEDCVRSLINEDFMSISATSNFGIDELKNRIRALFENNVSFDSPMISRLRHKTALEKSLVDLADATAALNNKMSFEFVSFDVRKAISCLSEITGEITTKDILDNVFSGFCIGK
jgi:tRNA modification GTPase